jgi:UDP-sugar transporter A1/2/3
MTVATSEEFLKYAKYGSLMVLVVQTSSIAMLMRYTRTQNVEYQASTAVFITEVVKFVFCTFMVFYQRFSTASEISGATADKLGDQVPGPTFFAVIFGRDSLRMLVPAALYAVQNNLLFIALSNLDSVSYQVLYQSKIATTAFFAWLMLNKHLNRGYVFSFFDR